MESFVKLACYNKNSLIFAFMLGFLGHSQYFMPALSNGPMLNLPINQMQSSPCCPPCPNAKSEEFDLDWNLEEKVKSLDQTDSRLVKYARTKYLTPPSKLPYQDVGRVIPDELSWLVAEIFENKRNGIFIEAGANEGVEGSHTLYVEMQLNWTGLLVECDPEIIPTLKGRQRKAWIASACLASGTKPGILNFSVPYEFSHSGLLKRKMMNTRFVIGGEPTKSFQLELETMPLFTLLAGIGWTEIDYFNLDMEGSELAILRGFPFDRVIFKILKINVYFYDDKQKKELDELLRPNNYHFVGIFGIDNIYVHGSVKDELNLKRFDKSWWDSFWW